LTIRQSAGICFACITIFAGLATSAHAQSGGTAPPGSTEPTEPAPSSGSSWTTYKSATWYGPGLFGERTACGVKLKKKTIGTAHKKLPCGTQVTFTHNGASITTTVIDRGPFRKGYAWDLTKKTAKRIGFLAAGSGPIQATVTPSY
jgi:rare lipoprotein A (peptidoglycan hydrolase)